MAQPRAGARGGRRRGRRRRLRGRRGAQRAAAGGGGQGRPGRVLQVRWRACVCVFMCVCVCASIHTPACVCVCVCASIQNAHTQTSTRAAARRDEEVREVMMRVEARVDQGQLRLKGEVRGTCGARHTARACAVCGAALMAGTTLLKKHTKARASTPPPPHTRTHTLHPPGAAVQRRGRARPRAECAAVLPPLLAAPGDGGRHAARGGARGRRCMCTCVCACLVLEIVLRHAERGMGQLQPS